MSSVEPVEAHEVIVDVRDELAALGPNQSGQLIAWPAESGWAYSAAVRPGLSADDLERYRSWVASALTQLHATNDPEENGWAPSQNVPDGWHMTAVTNYLPDME